MSNTNVIVTRYGKTITSKIYSGIDAWISARQNIDRQMKYKKNQNVIFGLTDFDIGSETFYYMNGQLIAMSCADLFSTSYYQNEIKEIFGDVRFTSVTNMNNYQIAIFNFGEQIN